MKRGRPSRIRDVDVELDSIISNNNFLPLAV